MALMGPGDQFARWGGARKLVGWEMAEGGGEGVEGEGLGRRGERCQEVNCHQALPQRPGIYLGRARRQCRWPPVSWWENVSRWVCTRLPGAIGTLQHEASWSSGTLVLGNSYDQFAELN